MVFFHPSCCICAYVAFLDRGCAISVYVWASCLVIEKSCWLHLITAFFFRWRFLFVSIPVLLRTTVHVHIRTWKRHVGGGWTWRIACRSVYSLRWNSNVLDLRSDSRPLYHHIVEPDELLQLSVLRSSLFGDPMGDRW